MWEGEDLFLVKVDVDEIRLTIWSMQSRPAINYWIWCILEPMMPLSVHIHSGWRQVLERCIPTVGLTSMMAVLMTTLARHLRRVSEIPMPDVFEARAIMLRIFGHLADTFA